jgi:hypothetical protein
MIEWKKIEEAPDYYISNRGEILSKRCPNERLMTLHTNKVTGYPQICLVVSEKGDKVVKATFYPHQLVAKYFVDNPKGYSTVHHKDHNKTNNHYWNLEWVSQEQNIYAYYRSDEKNKPRQMKAVEVWTIDGNYIATYPSVNKAAKEMGVKPSTVHNQCKKPPQNPKTYFFKYKED